MTGAREGEEVPPVTDERLERELREVLQRRHPGPAPFSLRERVLDVPAARQAAPEAHRLLVPALGLAAALALVAIGVQVAGLRATDGTVGASPSPAQAAVSSFDPDLVGPGIVTSSGSTLVPLLVVLVTITFLVLIVALRGWRRLVPAAGAVACVAFGLYASQVPIDVGTYGYGPGLNTVEAVMPRGTDAVVFYETAPPGRPFSFPLFLTINAPVPVRIEGLYQPATVSTAPRPAALWIDAEPNGGNLGPGRPFAPVEVTGWIHALWVVGRAGACAVGQPIDPANPPTDLGYTWIDSVTLQTSVFGWPRTIEVPLPFRLVEFQVDPCTPDAAPSSGVSPDTSNGPGSPASP